MSMRPRYRRQVRPYTRKSRSFRAKVLESTSNLQTIVDTTSAVNNGGVGVNQYFAPEPMLSKTFDDVIQNRLNADQLSDVAQRKSYYIQNAKLTTTYTNFAGSKACVWIYSYVARSNQSKTPQTLLLEGYSEDTNYLATGINTTPFQSSDFVAAFKITGVRKRWLEQGESITQTDMIMNKYCNNDLYNDNQIVKGSRGHLFYAQGTAVLDAGTQNVTTGHTKFAIISKFSTRFRQMADSVKRGYVTQQLSTSLVGVERFANSDVGAFATGTGNDV